MSGGPWTALGVLGEALPLDRARSHSSPWSSLNAAIGDVPRVRFHDLRHSCATLLYDQGVSIENIQDVLGHMSPTITKTIYVEATRRVQRDAVDRLGFLFDE